ncbi:MAG: rhodanese-like domain-containing protein [Blautia sp.]
MAGFDTISAHELDLFCRKKNALIIDLRSHEEFAESHYRGAVNIPYEELEDWEKVQTEKLPKEKILVLYCDRGSASLMAARELMKKGYRVKSVVGGIRAYNGSNLYFSPRHSKIRKTD